MADAIAIEGAKALGGVAYEEALKKGGKAYVDFFKPQTVGGKIDKFYSDLGIKNIDELNAFMYHLDKATDEILNPRSGYYNKSNRFAGSMKDLKTTLFNDKDFVKKYINLLNEQSKKKGSSITTKQFYDINELVKEDKKIQEDIMKLINQRTKYGLTIKEEVQPTIPSTDKKKEPETLWAPRFKLGGQDILRLNDVEKLEELKNFTLFDLVTPLLDGDPNNLLAIQNDIKQKLRFYNNYPLPKPEKELPKIPAYVEQWGRPMMNTNPVPYPFKLDQTGNQLARNYYNTWADQEKTELNNDVDVLKRSNLNPDVMNILNSNKTKKEEYEKISDEDLFIHFRN